MAKGSAIGLRGPHDHSPTSHGGTFKGLSMGIARTPVRRLLEYGAILWLAFSAGVLLKIEQTYTGDWF